MPLLPVLACLLGGATEKWAEGIVVGFLGLLLLVRPPRVSLGLFLNGILIALLACAATAFLPARWFFEPAWRRALISDFAVNVGSTVSPQPWLSFGCFVSLLAALSWLYYVATQALDNRTVRHQLRIFAGGVALLAALAIGLYLARVAPPFWHSQRGFGPFPNRNQTADLLGITTAVILACGYDDIRQRRKRWIFWLATFAVVVAAVVLNFSRAGIAILVAGSALWLGSFALRRGSSARLALGACALLALLTIMLVVGGQTLERFNLRGDGAGVTSDFRWLIFRDAWQLIRESPWCGIGLANFEPVFAIFRNASIGHTKALHPESDWLWVCAELGWPSVLLIVAGAALLIRRVLPLDEGTNQRFRIAALIAALLFGLHGFVDVSAHRVGTAYAGVLLLGLALRRPLELRTSRTVPAISRAIGLLLIAAGVTWTYAAWQKLPLPSGVGVDNARRAAVHSNQERNFAETITHAQRGLQ
ncbi:MAG: O-antigen ligase family protein, partial [Chthoniobacterales bacterium]|nr:O-antigen ligase family protein [Chthoniobacterales bacterium]